MERKAAARQRVVGAPSRRPSAYDYFDDTASAFADVVDFSAAIGLVFGRAFGFDTRIATTQE